MPEAEVKESAMRDFNDRLQRAACMAQGETL